MSEVNKANFESIQKVCEYCKKKVTLAVTCERCDLSYHPSCGKRVGTVFGENKFNCCKTHCESEVKADEMNEKQMKDLLEKMFVQYLNPFKDRMEKGMGDLKKSVKFMSDSFDDQKKNFETMMLEMKHLKEENQMLKQKIGTIEGKLNHIEQKEKENNLLVAGIPKQDDDKESIRRVFNAMKVKLAADDVREVYRINNKEDAPIMLKLKNQEIRSKVLSAIRQLKGIKLGECGLVGGDKNKNIYFNEDLTRQNQLLFRKVREIKKTHRYKSAFVASGKIYLVRGENDRPIRIKSEMDPELH